MPAPAYRYLPPHLADRLDGMDIGVRRPLPGGMQGSHRSRHHGGSVEFTDYRAYAEGDPIQRIDWAVYARTDRHLIRRNEDEVRLRVHLLLDHSGSMGYATGGRASKLHHACALAAGIMYVLARQGDAVGLNGFTDRLGAELPAASSREGLRPLLLGLEAFQAKGRSAPASVLHAFADQPRPRGLVVVLSDLLQEVTALVGALAHLQQAGHQVLLLHVLDPGELQMPFEGVVELDEMETGERVVLAVDDYRAAYAAEVRRHLDDLRRAAQGLGGGYHLADTATPIDAAIRDGLRWI
jgi:uncharacterized protein (DUF58 family)